MDTRWYNKKIFCIPIWAVGIAVLVAAAAYAQTQTLQLTTYYPAPYGEYTQLRVASLLEVLDGKVVFKGLNPSRTYLQIDPNETDITKRVAMSGFYDIDNTTTTYFSDPAGGSRLKQLQVEEVVGGLVDGVKFGEMKFDTWPVVAKAAGNAHIDNISATSGDLSKSSSMKIYYGSFKNSPPVSSVEIQFLAGKNAFKVSSYFVMISPRKLTLSGTFGYKVTTSQRNKFTVTFDAGSSIPTEFDWIAIGY